MEPYFYEYFCSVYDRILIRFFFFTLLWSSVLLLLGFLLLRHECLEYFIQANMRIHVWMSLFACESTYLYTNKFFLSWKCLPSWSIYAHGRKLNVKIKLNVKSARQPINLAYILLSFLDRQNSSFLFFL